MSDPTASQQEWQRRLDYYKRKLDELAGENLRKDYAISSARQEIKQKRAGMALLMQLQRSLGASQEPSTLFQTTMTAINGTLGMARTIILTPSGTSNSYRPTLWTGFSEEGRYEEFVARMQIAELGLPEEFSQGQGHLLVNKSTPSTPLIDYIRETFELPYFVCVPVYAAEQVIGVILTGRIKEVVPAAHPLNEGDVETLTAIAGLISNVVENMRIAVLEETNRLKTDFFANISHEFRTPITLTLGPISALISGRYGKLTDRSIEQLMVVQRNQERLLGLVNQILDIAKLEAGQMELKAARVPDVNSFLHQRLQQFRSMADRRNLDLRCKLAPEVEASEIYLDVEKLDKIIFNLLSNALKFTKQGFVELATEIRGNRFVLAVSDSGIGIRTDQLPHIFDRFRQADGSASRDYAGTGIGLALVKELVELQGGVITVHSEYGKGTAFAVSFPTGSTHLLPSAIVEWTDEDSLTLGLSMHGVDVREGAQDLAADETEALTNRDTEGLRDHAKPTVLYVDDNRDLRHYVKGLLSQDYNVFLAVNGAMGLESAREYHPDLILSDLMMPVMNGTAFCERVRADPTLSSLPFILLTARSSMDDKIAGLEEGADDYLSKPFSERELMARIRNLITIRQQQLQIKRELAAARNIQQALLPVVPFSTSRLQLDALYHPSEELSGDFFDHRMVDGWLYFYIADVTSHGTAAAQVTYLVKGLFQEALQRGGAPSLADTLAFVQDRYARYALNYDVAIQLVRVHPDGARLDYLAANAPPALRVGAHGQTQSLNAPPSTSLTSRPSKRSRARYQHVELELSPPEGIYFYTDGCYEFAADDRQFGKARLARVFRELPRQGWVSATLDAFAAAHRGLVFSDDLTIVRLTVASND